MLLVVSGDEDFSGVLARQLTRELAIDATRVATLEQAQELAGQEWRLVITTDNITEKFDCPVWHIAPADARNPSAGARLAPIKLQELLAEIRDLLQKPAAHGTMALGAEMSFIPQQKLLKCGAKSATLTDKEAQLLQSFIAGKGQMVSKEALLKDVWKMEPDMNTHTLETHIYRLRAKFRELGHEEAIIAADGGYGLDIK